MFYDYLALGVERGQIPQTVNIQAVATLFFTFYNGLKVVTKIDFDEFIFSESVDTMLAVLN